MKEVTKIEHTTDPSQVTAAAINRTAIDAMKAGKMDEAMTLIQEAIATDPTNAAYYSNKGAFQAHAKNYSDAVESLMQAAALDPRHTPIHENLAIALSALGELDATITACENVLALQPMNRDLMDALIFYGDYHERSTPENALRLRQHYQRTHLDTQPRYVSYPNDRNPDRQLRVGYVSGDYCNHSAMGTVLPVFEAHTPSVYTIAYSTTAPDRLQSATSTRIKQAVKEWWDIRDMTEDAAAALIRSHAVDILVDLSGYSRDHRLGTFARYPAPVQVHGWGCMVGTTGLQCFQYIFADPHVVSERARPLFTESIIELPCVISFPPPSEDYPLNDTPALTRPHFTFGSFNRLTKISQATLDLWADVLKAIPTSRMIMKTTQQVEVPVWERYRGEFGERGVDPARIEFQPQTSRAQHLLRMHDVDLVLDTYPHTGGVTTAEGMWMGVPPLTLVGDTVVSRLSYSFLQQVDLADKFAVLGGMDAREAYVERARYWTEHIADLNWQRRRLRQRMRQSAWLDAYQYTMRVEEAYRAAWRRWCEQ
jgi:predicted O-linked N-acetylglucosamine transferase (SPINDLY family)